MYLAYIPVIGQPLVQKSLPIQGSRLLNTLAVSRFTLHLHPRAENCFSLIISAVLLNMQGFCNYFAAGRWVLAVGNFMNNFQHVNLFQDAATSES